MPEFQVSRPIDNHWRAEYVIAEQDGVSVIAQVTITPRAMIEDGQVKARIPPGGLTTRVLRSVPMTSDVMHGPSPDNPGEVMEFAGFSDEAIASALRPRGHRISDRFLAEVAREYEQLSRNNPDGMVAELCEQLAERGVHYKVSGMRELLHKARERGLLTNPKPGHGGGRLTDKAQSILNNGR